MKHKETSVEHETEKGDTTTCVQTKINEGASILENQAVDKTKKTVSNSKDKQKVSEKSCSVTSKEKVNIVVKVMF